MLALPAAASAAPALDGKFSVSGEVQRLARGPDGNVWFTLGGLGVTKEFGRITPSGAVTEYDTPMDMKPVGITRAPDGQLWMTAPNNVISFSPGNPAGATAHAI